MHTNHSRVILMILLEWIAHLMLES